MTCYLSRSDWHSYVRNDLSERDLHKMKTHLVNCPECRGIVTDIQHTTSIFARHRTSLNPPQDLKIRVMKSIDLNKYKNVKRSYLFELKNWGLSLVAAGALLLTLNLTSWTPNLEPNQVADLNRALGEQLALPFEKISLVTHNTLRRIDLNIDYVK